MKNYYNILPIIILLSLTLSFSFAQTGGEKELRLAYESALIQVKESGNYSLIFQDDSFRMKNTLLADCGASSVYYPFPQSDGSLSRVLESGILRIGTPRIRENWHISPNSDPISGSMVVLFDEIVQIISSHYGVSLVLQWVRFESATDTLDALKDGVIDIAAPLLGGWVYRNESRRRAFKVACSLGYIESEFWIHNDTQDFFSDYPQLESYVARNSIIGVVTTKWAWETAKMLLPTVDWRLVESESVAFDAILDGSAQIGMQLFSQPSSPLLSRFTGGGGFEYSSLFRRDPTEDEEIMGGYAALRMALDTAFVEEFADGMFFEEWNLEQGKRASWSQASFNCLPYTGSSVYRYPEIPNEERGLSRVISSGTLRVGTPSNAQTPPWVTIENGTVFGNVRNVFERVVKRMGTFYGIGLKIEWIFFKNSFEMLTALDNEYVDMSHNFMSESAFHVNQRRNEFFQIGCGAYGMRARVFVAENGSWTDLETIMDAINSNPLSYKMAVSGDGGLSLYRSLLPKALWVNYGTAENAKEAVLNGSAIAGSNIGSPTGLKMLVLDSLNHIVWMTRKDTPPTPYQNLGGRNPPDTCDLPQKLKVQVRGAIGAEYAGLISAQIGGFFEEECLSVEILAGGLGFVVADSVGQDVVEIGIDTVPSILDGIFRGHDLLIISQIFQAHDTKIWVVNNGTADSMSVEDLKGKKIGISSSVAIQELQVLRQFGLLDYHYLTEQEPEIEKSLVNGEIDALISTGFSGFEQLLRITRPSDSHIEGLLELYQEDDFVALESRSGGIGPAEILSNFYHSAVVVKQKYAEENKELLSKFLRALTKGWIKCRDDFEGCFNDLPTNSQQQRWELAHSLDLVWGVDRNRRFGTFDDYKWHAMIETLLSQASIPGSSAILYDSRKNTTLQELVLDELSLQGLTTNGTTYESISNMNWCVCSISEACNDPGQAFICRGDEKTPTIEKVSSDARYTFIVLATICACVCIITFFWIFHRRDSAVIQSASPKFLLLMMVGLFMKFVSIVIYSAHISPATCHLVVYIFTIGFTLLFGSLIAKSHRVWKIFALKNFKRVAYSDRRVLAFVGVLLFFDFVLLILFSTIRSPSTVFSTDTNDSYTYYEQCDFHEISIYLLLSYKGIIVIMAFVMAFKTRKVNVSFFNEARYIAITIYNLSFVFVIIVPLIFSVSTILAQYILAMTAILFSSSASFVVLFGPKLRLLLKYTDKNLKDMLQRQFTSTRISLGKASLNAHDSSNAVEKTTTTASTHTKEEEKEEKAETQTSTSVETRAEEDMNIRSTLSIETREIEEDTDIRSTFSIETREVEEVEVEEETGKGDVSLELTEPK